MPPQSRFGRSALNACIVQRQAGCHDITLAGQLSRQTPNLQPPSWLAGTNIAEQELPAGGQLEPHRPSTSNQGVSACFLLEC
jgi:hypothetical protein